MKNPLGISVLEAARKRIEIIFDNFSRIYVSFSGGKDSAVMLHLVAKEAIKRKVKIGCLFIDLEGQYKITIDYIKEIFNLYKDIIYPYWVCLPIALRNAVSVFEPKWQCWAPDKKDIWVRDIPDMAISDESFFPFFKRNMEFEEFVPEFGKWYSQGKPTAAFIGIRADESYSRYLKVKVKKNREFFDNHMWALKQKSTGMEIYSVHPIYDWRTRDIWIYNYKEKKPYNHLYDIMHKAGLTIHQQRICQPYGDDQRKGLWLFQVIEPDTWAKLISRVNGANGGAEFVKYSGNSSGQIKITKPPGHTWKSFSEVLLSSMPERSREHYANKIHVFLRFYEERGYSNGIPDEADIHLEAQHKVPSWRRIAKMLLRNDYIAKTIGFVQNKDGFFYKRYTERIKKEREKMKLENLKNSRGGIKWMI
jgi:predicted phosphoadenosine phosphosulfate sulfurtransferase